MIATLQTKILARSYSRKSIALARCFSHKI
jgi:protoheme IX farnesyltransferase